MYCPTAQDLKVFKVQRTRFCNIFNVSNDTPFTKDWLLSIVKANVDDPIDYEGCNYPATFPMKFLAKQILLMEFHTYT